MRAGVTVVDPATTWVDADGHPRAGRRRCCPASSCTAARRSPRGAVIGPDRSRSPTPRSAPAPVSPARWRSRHASAPGVTVGPFAYLRPGTELADGVHIGTYVEVKNSEIGAGSKVPHLTYVGDATIGEHTNIGAATVFVNYDGVAKHRSAIGDHARTGADNMFVAPVQRRRRRLHRGRLGDHRGRPARSAGGGARTAAKRGRLGSAPTPDRGTAAAEAADSRSCATGVDRRGVTDR